MAVDGVSSSSSSSSSSLAGSRTTIAENFDTFLQILVTQLKNQNPLDPLDTNQFTQQLVQFTSVEQQLKTNEFLEALMLANQTAVNTDAVSYIGKEVSASGVKADLKEGEARWGFNAAAQAANATVTIKDANGSVVYLEEGSLAAGEGEFVWDGTTTTGAKAPDGTYSISIEATDLAGKKVSVSTASTGLVTAVDFSGDEPMLTVGGNKIRLSTVTSVKVPAST